MTTNLKALSVKPNPVAHHAEGLWRQALRRLFRQQSGIVCMIIVGFLILVAIFAPLIAPYDPIKVLIGVEEIKKRAKPCIHLLGCSTERPQHLMGIDGNVRDEFSRVIFGTRISFFIGFFTIGLAIIVGTVLGSLAAYIGGWADNIIMRFMDVLLAFPFLLLAIAIVAVLGPGLINAIWAIAIINIPAFARVIRSSVLAIKEEEYVSAARAVGVPPAKILALHILPNALSPLIVQGTLGIATAILGMAALSFLGMGAQPPPLSGGRWLASNATKSLARRTWFFSRAWPL